LDAYLISLDLSDSTVLVESVSGWATLSVKLEDGTLASTSAEWSRNGSEIVLTSPSSLEFWLDNLQSDITEFEVNVQDIEVIENDGTNVFSVQFEYDQEVLAGASTSWYESPNSGCDGIFPDVQLCGN